MLLRPFVLLLIPALGALAQGHASHAGTPAAPGARLGTISFPNSGAAAAQPDFIRGVLLMHSFEYDDAGNAFRAAQAKDPDFVLAYWGEALSYTHPIWNQQDLVSARRTLTRLAPTRDARAAKAGTARERAWLETVEILYGEGEKAQRDTLYEQAVARLAVAHPDDESATFHALAIMGLSQGVRNVDAYMRAGAIALRAFNRNPDHPGAAHYVIHAFDDPTHAILGLDAANAYSEIAPGAAHAQHMTTHIYLALGMWDGVISQNVLASGPDRSRWQAGHYTYWLHYGLLQAGRIDEAVALLDTLHAHAGPNASASRRDALAQVRAQQIISAERWDDASLRWTLHSEESSPHVRAGDAFARGYAAIQRGDLAEAARVLATMQGMATASGPALPRLIVRELEAALTRARGDAATAERMLREVSAEVATLPMEFGPPAFVKPPLELLAEWLHADGRTEEARRVLAEAEAMTPGRLRLRALAGR